MSEKKKDDKRAVVALDAYRKDWSVGLVYCAHCNRSMPHLWVSGATVVNCPECKQLIDLVIDYGV